MDLGVQMECWCLSPKRTRQSGSGFCLLLSGLIWLFKHSWLHGAESLLVSLVCVQLVDKPRISYCVQKSLPFVPTLIVNPAHTLPSYVRSTLISFIFQAIAFREFFPWMVTDPNVCLLIAWGLRMERETFTLRRKELVDLLCLTVGRKYEASFHKRVAEGKNSVC